MATEHERAGLVLVKRDELARLVNVVGRVIDAWDGQPRDLEVDGLLEGTVVVLRVCLHYDIDSIRVALAAADAGRGAGEGEG